MDDRSPLRPVVAAGRAARKVVVVDRSGIAVRSGLTAALPVVAMLALGTLVGQPVAAVTLAVGAMLAGVAWRGAGGTNRPPLGTMAGAVLAVSVATLAGTLSGRSTWLHLALLVLFCLQAGLVTTLGRRGNVIGTQSVIAFIVFGRFPVPITGALELSALVLGGGAAQVALAALIARPGTRRRQREAVGEAYRELAALLAAPRASSLPAATALDAAEGTLAVPTLFADPALLTLAKLVDQGRRIRLEMITLGNAGAAAGANSDAERVAVRLAALTAQIETAERRVQGADGAERQFGRPSRGPWRPAAAARSDLRRLRAAASLHSPAGRHAIRLAVVVAGTELLVQRAALPRAYWAVVAAATVLRPEFTATFTRGAERVAGTFAGVVIASLIAVALNPSGWGIVAIVGLLAWGTYAVFPASFATGIAGLTGIVIFLLHGVAPASVTLALDRGVDTLIGGAIGLAAYALWPTWSGQTLGHRLAGLVDAQRAYLAAVLAALTDGHPLTTERLRPLARRARTNYSEAEAAITLAQSEPIRGADPNEAAVMLAGLRRLVHAVHAVRVRASEAPAPHADQLPPDASTALPLLAPLASALLDTLANVAERLRDDRAPELAPPLRPLHGALTETFSDSLPVPIASALEDLTDAVETVATSAGIRLPAK